MLKMILALILSASLAVGTGVNTYKAIPPEEWSEVSLRVAGYRNFNDDPLNYEFAAGAKKFTEEYGTTVDFIVGGGDGMGEDLVAAIVCGDPWDIQYCFGISVFPLNFAEGLYTPITRLVDYENEMIDALSVEGTRWLGELYGVSNLPMQEIWYLAYNETWMKELGLKTPHEYLAEDNWTLETYKELNAAAAALNAPSRSSFTRPHVGSKYMCDWNKETGEVTVTYDSPENVAWLSYWSDLLTKPEYNIKGGGFVSGRNSIMRDEVMPNLIKDELTQETTDTIRYIHYPNEDGSLGVYLTDSHFLFPQGVPEEKLPCAFMLACYMANEKSEILSRDTYAKNMSEEDWALFQENMNNAYYLPRIFYKGVFAIGNIFRKDMDAGKSVATHIVEQTPKLRERAKEFNDDYIY